MTLKPKIDYDRDDVIMIEQDGSGHTLAQPTKIFIVKSCEQCELPSRVEIDDETRDYCEVTCLHCESPTRAERLYATESEGSCDTRCMFASGQICICACGGDNHAGSWRFSRFKSIETASAVEKLLAQRKKTVERRVQRERTKQEEAARPFNEWLESLDDEVRKIVDWLTIYENVQDHHILVDLRLRMRPRPGKEIKYPARPLTDKQLHLAAGQYAYAMRKQEREAEWEKIKKPVPEGRHEIAGEIISRRADDERDFYGHEITKYKILVKCDGFKIWGTCPNDLIDDVFPCYSDAERTEQNIPNHEVFKSMPRGLKIEMRATLKRSDDDASFGFYSRPFNAKIVDEPKIPGLDVTVREAYADPYGNKKRRRTSQSAPEKSTPSETKTSTEQTSQKRSDKPKSNSHADCTHESSKSARAKCRRERRSK